ncbi:P-loop containing nucleoside triphosphate hydrolase protein [Crucibulum laeve]|uniref:P-loop containing nucleoside triphosphate hydrolase protein n=1 Tax=Crucibulum laeve TaxID=68775 RepID=A0A5C3LJN3_9AGAR|nr:P-loop containing nucleoside triphosphate hydrolase protein [Crucibulum laeve]
MSPTTRHFSWGIFEVAYDVYPARPLCSVWNLECIRAFEESLFFFLCFLAEFFEIAPRALTLHLLGYIWMSISPVFSLYLGWSVLEVVSYLVFTLNSYGKSWQVQELILSKRISDYDRMLLQIFICMWLLSVSTSIIVERLLEENKLILGGHLRSHFLPELAKGRLDHKLRMSLPDSWAFGEIAPGLDFFEEFTMRIRSILTLILQVVVLVHIISQMGPPDSHILSCLVIIFLFIMFFAPSNGVGGFGYTFWTKNEHYHRLNSLYSIIFNDTYRQTLVKDEYKKSSDALGIAKSDTLALACTLPPPWYWVVARNFVIDYPMALYALTLPWRFSSSSLTTMALFQYAIVTLKQGINCLRGCHNPVSLHDIMRKAQRLYETIESNKQQHLGAGCYPDSLASYPKGMKLSFRNVSFRYEDTINPEFNAVNNITLDIEPGQLVVIVGANGSGKTSLLNLLPRLAEPTSGEIYIDDKPSSDYDTLQIRRSIAFLAQNEQIYPVSLRENILMGLTGVERKHADNPEKISEAAVLGGSYDLMSRLGWDTILNRCGVVGQSMRGCGNGDIGDGALAELERNSPSSKEISISCGEKQRLIASRTFMRVKNSSVKLLVVDEPTSSLDPIAERELFNRFRELRDGRTVIFVSHRFGNLVKHADLIM